MRETIGEVRSIKRVFWNFAMNVDPNSVGEWLQTGKGAIDLLKAGLGLMPQGPARDQLQEKIHAAETALKRSDALLAQKLGYPLCRCTFPPSIMLTNHAEQFVYCVSCGHKVSTARPEPEEPSCSWLDARNG